MQSPRNINGVYRHQAFQALKSVIRENFLKKRELISKSSRALLSDKIAKKLMSLEEFQKNSCIMLYASIKSEVETYKIIKECLGLGKKVVLPCSNISNINPCELSSMEELKPGYLRIPEPAIKRHVRNKEIGLVVVPVVAFDQKGARLGYGRGYYDKFLANSKAVKVGLAFEAQIHPGLPEESHDVRLDFVITENRIISFKNKELNYKF